MTYRVQLRWNFLCKCNRLLVMWLILICELAHPTFVGQRAMRSKTIASLDHSFALFFLLRRCFHESVVVREKGLTKFSCSRISAWRLNNVTPNPYYKDFWLKSCFYRRVRYFTCKWNLFNSGSLGYHYLNNTKIQNSKFGRAGGRILNFAKYHYLINSKIKKSKFGRAGGRILNF